MLPIIPYNLIQKIVEVDNQTVTEPPMLPTSNLTIQAELKAGEILKDMVQRCIAIGQASHLKNIPGSYQINTKDRDSVTSGVTRYY